MATAIFPRPTDDLWLLASTVVYEAREVASELPEPAVRFVDVVKGVSSVLWTTAELRVDFKRLASRQAKFLGCFDQDSLEAWSHENCAQMSQLLSGLTRDERTMLEKAFRGPRLLLPFWETSLNMLRDQADQLDAICQRLDALSVPETVMDGDEGCRDFMTMLNAPVEYDFSTEGEKRRASLTSR
jgi:hypothetical protein